MQYLNLEIRHLCSEEYIGAEPVDRATWITLLAYCALQENGGRIVACRGWGDRRWQQIVRVTADEVSRESKLWSWDGTDLIVWQYPTETERRVSENRRITQAAGRSVSDAKTQAARENGKKGGRPRVNPPETQPKTQQTETQEPNQKPNVKERKGMEGKEKEEYPPNPQGGSPASPSRDGAEDKSSQFKSRLSRMFNRRESTVWSEKEIRQFKALLKQGHITPENLSLLERYYSQEKAKGEKGIHRRDLLTFLNNFTGELDRANGSQTPIPASPAPQGDPAGWEDFLASINAPYRKYSAAPGFLRDDFRKWLQLPARTAQ